MGDLVAGLVVGRGLISGWPITVTCISWTGGRVDPVDITVVNAQGLLDCIEPDIVSGSSEFFVNPYCAAAAVEFSQNIINLFSVPCKISHSFLCILLFSLNGVFDFFDFFRDFLNRSRLSCCCG